MSSPFLPGPDASRPRSGMLTPTSDGALNRIDGSSASSGGQKRKRPDSVTMDHLLKPAITLKPHPPNLHVQPRLLQPLLLLPREHLPLSYLDLSNPQGDLPTSRLVESHIKILDLERRMGSRPKVLIARSEQKGTLYALERHDNGLYVACKLGSWTNLESLASLATALCQERIRSQHVKTAEQTQPTALVAPQTHKDQRQKRVAIEAIQSLVRKRARSQFVTTFDDATRPASSTNSQEQPVALSSSDIKPAAPSDPVQKPEEKNSTPVTSAEADVGQQQTAEAIFDNIRTHYFDVLYKSKGSLAYFAKGPLSRARSAFHLDLESNLDINDLIDFLKGLVLTTVQIDKKYRETIPELISKIKPVVDSSDEGRRKPRRPKKMRLGKDGLYPLEDEKVERWWAANKPELSDDNESGITMEQIKAHASFLRTRETQLQMIVILETLALEPLKPQEQTADALPTLPGAAESQNSMAPPPPKKRNKHNLPTLIDVHTDRLTIWQSTASQEQILLQDSQAPSSLAGNSEQKASSEPLRDFCVDVIVPFYSSRLPQLCDSLSRKLGGPVIISPPKPKHKSKTLKRSSSSNKRDQKPGAAARRTALRQEPRTLESALSFEKQHRRSLSRGPSQIEHLMRATSASAPSIKREDSDSASLKALIKAEAGPQHKRASLSRSSSLAGLEDSKASKKAKIEAELRDAISNLRKPNREVVGKAMAEAAEHKMSTAVSAKKPRRPNRPVVNPGIQVKATPVSQRFKYVMGPKSSEAAEVPLASTEEMVPPSSVGPHVPSTTLAEGYKNVWQNGALAAGEVVGSTPQKKSTGQSFLRRPAYEEPAIPPSSPLAPRKTAPWDSPIIPGSVVKPASRPGLTAVPFDDMPVTPSKKMTPRSVGNEKQGQKEKQTSIYQTLGWDDDDLDDLL